MSSALIHLTNRPSVIYVGSCAVMVNVHDQWFLNEYNRLRTNVIDCHPDRRQYSLRGIVRKDDNQIISDQIASVKWLTRPHTTGPFRRAQEDLKRFLQIELRWYEQYGLLPPTKQHIKKEPLPKRGGLRFESVTRKLRGSSKEMTA